MTAPCPYPGANCVPTTVTTTAHVVPPHDGALATTGFDAGLFALVVVCSFLLGLFLLGMSKYRLRP